MLHAILFDDLDFAPILEHGVEESCFLFLRSMLDVDGNSRPPAEELLAHPWIEDVVDVRPIKLLDEMAPLPQAADSKLATLHEEDKEDEWNGFDETESFAQAARGLLPSSSTEEPGPTRDLTSARNSPSNALGNGQLQDSNRVDSFLSNADSPSQLVSEDIDTQRPPWSNLPEGIPSNTDSNTEIEPGSDRSTEFTEVPWIPKTRPVSSRTDDATRALVQTIPKPRALPRRPVTTRLFGEISPEDLLAAESGIFGAISPPVINPGHSPGLSGTQEKMEKLNVGSLSREASVSQSNPTVWVPKGKRNRATAAEKVGDSTDSSVSGEPALKRSMIRAQSENVVDESGAPNEGDLSHSVSQGINTLCLQGSSYLGILYPTPGSFSDVPLNLTTRLTTFGRDYGNTHVYQYPSDTRVARAAIDIYFYSSTAPKFRGPGWHKFDGINAVIMTRSQRGIRVNGTKLPCSPRGGPFKCGKLRTGDLIELFSDNESHLTYRCEFHLGESMEERAIGETFAVEDDPELFAAAVASS